jgi:glutathione S-transferase
MQLFDGGRAPNPRRVRIFMAEKGISVPMVFIDINRLEHKTTDFAALNPMQRTPVLQLDDGACISESVAICRYFEELYPDPPLMGRDPFEKAQVEMWQRRIELNLLGPIAHVFRHEHPAMAEMERPQIPEFAAANRPRVVEALAVLDKALQDRPFICGQQFTIADITGLVALDFMKPAKLDIPSEFLNILGWYQRLKGRPSAAA